MRGFGPRDPGSNPGRAIQTFLNKINRSNIMPKTKKAEDIKEVPTEESEETFLTENLEAVKKDLKEKKGSEKKESSKKSKKPEKQTLTEAQFKKKISELASQDLTSEKIGESLRRQGIHPAEHLKQGQSISSILKENNSYIDPDLKNVNEKFERVKVHFGTHKQDQRAKREVARLQSQVRNIKLYKKLI